MTYPDGTPWVESSSSNRPKRFNKISPSSSGLAWPKQRLGGWVLCLKHDLTTSTYPVPFQKPHTILKYPQDLRGSRRIHRQHHCNKQLHADVKSERSCAEKSNAKTTTKLEGRVKTLALFSPLFVTAVKASYFLRSCSVSGVIIRQQLWMRRITLQLLRRSLVVVIS